MNWDAIRFDWNQARAFLAVCEEGSLSAAARVLGQTQPTIGRQITALEGALSVVLFERAGHALVQTDTGRDLAVHVRAMAEAASHVSLTASGQSQDIAGQVRITASDIFAATILTPIIKDIHARAPALEIDVVGTNTISDLVQREADIAIRHIRPEEPDLIARLICQAKADFYGATSYLDQHGRPTNEDELAQHKWVSFGDVPEMIGHLTSLGVKVTPDHFPVGSANGLVAWELVKAGFGLMIMSRDVGANTPGIERLLPNRPPLEFPVWLVTHRELHTAKRIRLVYDMIAEALPRNMA